MRTWHCALLSVWAVVDLIYILRFGLAAVVDENCIVQTCDCD